MSEEVGFFSEGAATRPQRRYLSCFVKYNISLGHSFNNEVNRASESDLAALWRRPLLLIDTHFGKPDLESPCRAGPQSPLIRLSKMSIYKEERPSPDGRQITFPCSIHFIIDAMVQDNVIFDKTGETRALPGPGEAVQEKYTLR